MKIKPGPSIRMTDFGHVSLNIHTEIPFKNTTQVSMTIMLSHEAELLSQTFYRQAHISKLATNCSINNS